MGKQEPLHSQRTGSASVSKAVKTLRCVVTESIASLVFGTVFIALIPLANFDGTVAQKVFSYAISCLIWLSVIALTFSVCKASAAKKALEKRGFQIKKISRSSIGLFSFFKNREATVADIVLFVSLIGTVLLTQIKTKSEWILMICLALLFLSFGLHCIFNGRNYRYYRYIEIFIKKGAQKR